MSADQRMTALQKANEIRTKRSQLKRDIKAGDVLAAQVVADPPAWAETMRVVLLLRAVPGVGPAKIRRGLERYGVSASATLGSLSIRQRAALAALVEKTPRCRTAPGRGDWQPAMKLANTVRLDRARLHAEVMSLPAVERTERVAGLLESPPMCLASLPAADLLTWAHRVGWHRAVRFLRASRVPTARTVGMTTARQRAALAACLRGAEDMVREESAIREWTARSAA